MRVETSGSDEFYFIAPDKYLGDKRFAYTFTMSFKLQQDNATFPEASSTGDIILKGRWFDQPLVTSLSNPPSTGNSFTSYEVRVDFNIKRSATFMVQSTLFKTDTFGTGIMCLSYSDVRIIDNRLKGVKKGRDQL